MSTSCIRRNNIRYRQRDGAITILMAMVGIMMSGCGGGSSGGAIPNPVMPPNSAPTTSAGPDQTAAESSDVQLSGQGSDPDGDAISFSWSQISGASVQFESASDPATRIRTPAVPIGGTETLVLELRATDPAGASSSDQITINVASSDFLLFTSNMDDVDFRELHLYDPQLRTSRHLSAVTSNGGASGTVVAFALSPDNQVVAYIADQETPDQFELFAAQTDGSGVIKINEPLITGGDVSELSWSPDGTQIAYAADALTDDLTEVFLVDRDGANGGRISNDWFIPYESTGIQWSPDGMQIAFHVYDTAANRSVGIEVYSRASNTIVGLIVGLSLNSLIDSYAWSPDSARLAFKVYQGNPARNELFAARFDGSEFTNLSENLVVPGGGVIDYRWSPDGSFLAFTEQPGPGVPQEIFSARPDGTERNRLNGALVAGGVVANFLAWSPDGIQVLYLASQDVVDQFEFFVSRPGGSGNTKVNGPIIPGGTLRAPAKWTPDSNMIAYAGRQNDINTIELFRSNRDGTGNILLNPTRAVSSDVVLDESLSAWTASSQHILYAVYVPATGQTNMFVTDANGISTARITRDPAVGGDLQSFGYWSADDARIAYLSEQDNAGDIELYIASPDGLVNEKVSMPLVPGSLVFDDIAWSN